MVDIFDFGSEDSASEVPAFQPITGNASDYAAPFSGQPEKYLVPANIPTVPGQPKSSIAVTATPSLDSIAETKAAEESLVAIEKQKEVYLKSPDPNSLEMKVLQNAGSVEEAEQILGVAPGHYAGNLYVNKMFERKQLEAAEKEDAAITQEINESARLTDLRIRAESRLANGSFEEWQSAKQEWATIQKNAMGNIPRIVGDGSTDTEAWDNQFAAQAMTQIIDISAGVNKSFYLGKLAVLQNSMTDEGVAAVNEISKLKENALALDDSFERYKTFHKESGGSDAELAERTAMYEKERTAINDRVNTLRTQMREVTDMDRYENLQKSLEATNGSIDWGTEQDGKIKRLGKGLTDIGNSLTVQALHAPTVIAIGAGLVTGKTDEEIARDVVEASNKIKSVDDYHNEISDRIIDESKLDGLNEDITNDFVSIKNLATQYQTAVDSGDDLRATKLAGMMAGKSVASIVTSMANNPEAAALLAAGEAPQYLIGGGFKLFGTAVNAAGKKAARNAAESIQNDLDKTLEPIHKSINESKLDAKTSFNDINKKVAEGDFDSPELVAATQKLDAAKKATNISNAKKAEAIKEAQDELTAVKTKLDKKIKFGNAAGTTGNAVTTAAMTMEAANQGMIIYNAALQDYMAKTKGQVFTRDQATTVLAAATLAASLDLATDVAIGKTSGILNKFSKSNSDDALKALSPDQIDQVSKGIANRVMKSAGANLATVVPEAGTEGVQTDLEFNLANYLLGRDREAGSDLEVFSAAIKGGIVAGTLRAPKTAAEAAGIALDTTGKVLGVGVKGAKAGFDVAKNAGKTNYYTANTVKLTPDSIKVAAQDVKSFAKQTDDILRELSKDAAAAKSTPKVKDAISNIREVRKVLAAEASKANEANDDATYESTMRALTDLNEVYDRYKDLDPAIKSVETLKSQLKSQQDAGTPLSKMKFDKEGIDNIIVTLGSSPTVIEDPKDLEVLNKVAESTGRVDLAIALFDRIQKAAQDGIARKRMGKKQDDSKTGKQSTQSLEYGSASFIGLNEYVSAAKTISTAAKVSNRPEMQKAAEEKLTEFSDTFTKLKKLRITKGLTIKAAIDHVANTGENVLPPDIIKGLEDVSVVWKGAAAANILLKAIRADVENIIKYQTEFKAIIANEPATTTEKSPTTLESDVEERATATTSPKAEPKGEGVKAVAKDETEVSKVVVEDKKIIEPTSVISPDSEEAILNESLNGFDDTNFYEEILSNEAFDYQEYDGDELNYTDDRISLNPPNPEQSLGVTLLKSLPKERLNESEQKVALAAANKNRPAKKLPLLEKLTGYQYKNLLHEFFIPGRNVLTAAANIVLNNALVTSTVDYAVKTVGQKQILSMVHTLHPRVVKALETDVHILGIELFSDKTVPSSTGLTVDNATKIQWAGSGHYFRQLLNDDGQLPNEVTKAVTLALTRYLAKHGYEINNRSEKAIESLFQIDSDKDDVLPTEIYNKYKLLGVHDVAFMAEVGAEAFKFLGLREQDKSENFNQHIELVLGKLAYYAATKEFPIAEVNNNVNLRPIFEVDTSINSVEYRKDINSVKQINGKPLLAEPEYKSAIAKNAAAAHAKKHATEFIRFRLPSTAQQFEQASNDSAILRLFGVVPYAYTALATQFRDNKKIYKDMLEHNNTIKQKRPRVSEHLFDDIFLTESDDFKLPLTKPRVLKYLGKPKKLADAMNKHNQTKFRVNTELAGVFTKFLYENENAEQRNQFMKFLGVKTEEEMKNRLLPIRVGQLGVNNQIDSDLKAFFDMVDYYSLKGISLADQDLFLTSEFQNQNRFQLINSVNPLRSKLHRALLVLHGNDPVPTNWNATETFNDDVSFYHRVAILSRTKLKDGTGVKDTTVTEEAINKKFEEFTESKIFTDGVEAYQQLLALGKDDVILEETSKALQTFLDNMDSVGGGFEILNDFAQQRKAVEAGESTYKSTLSVPRDGISSGLALGVYTLSNPGTARAQDAANILAMTGLFSTISAAQNLNDVEEANSLDAYETVIYTFVENIKTVLKFPEMNFGIPGVKRIFYNRQEENAVSSFLDVIEKAHGFNWRLEELSTEENQRKPIRKLLKQPLISKLFGQGTPGTAKAFLNLYIDSIHKIIDKELVNGTDKETLAPIVDSLNLSLQKFTGKANIIKLDNLRDLDLYAHPEFLSNKKKFEKTFKSVAKLFEYSSKKALFRFSEVSKDINDTYNIMNAVYVGKREVEEAKFVEKAAKEQDTFNEKGLMELPKKFRRQLDKSLLVIAPTIRTPFSSYNVEDGDHINLAEHENTISSDGGKIIKLGLSSFPRRVAGTVFSYAGTTIKHIHPLEAAIAATAAGKFPVVNMYDNQTTLLQHAKAHALFINEKMLNMSRDYDPYKEMLKRTADADKALNAMYKDSELFSDFSNDALQNLLIALDSVDGFVEDVVKSNYRDLSKEDLLNKVKASYADHIKKYKDKLDSGESVKAPFPLVASNHYALPGGQYEIPIADRMELEPPSRADMDGIYPVSESEADTGEIGRNFGNSPTGTTSIFIAANASVTGVSATNIVDKLQMLQGMGDRIESTSNMEHLTNLLGNLFNPFIRDIQLHHDATGQTPAVGKIELSQSGTDIYINAGNGLNQTGIRLPTDGIPMSGAEILAHEVFHSLVYHLVGSTNPLMNQIDQIWKVLQARPDIFSAKDLIPEGDTSTDALERAETTYKYMFEAKADHRHLQEFVAIWATNEKMRKALSDVNITDLNNGKARFLSKAAKVLNNVYSFLIKALGGYNFNSADKNYTAQFDKLMLDLVSIETRTQNKLIKFIGQVAGLTGKTTNVALNASKFTINTVRQSAFFEDLTGKYGKAFNNLVDFGVTAVEERDMTIAKLLDKYEGFLSSHELLGMGEILTEIRGTTEKTQFVADLNRFRNNAQSKPRQEFITVTRTMLMKPFLAKGETKVSEQVMEDLLNGVVKTDLAVLLKDRTREEFVKYVTGLHYGELDKEILRYQNEITKAVDSNSFVANILHKSAQSLGHYLNHQEHTEVIGLSSVSAIVNNVESILRDEGIALKKYDRKAAKNAVDILATLYAFKGLDPDARDRMMMLMGSHALREEQDDGVFKLVSAHAAVQQKAKDAGLFESDLYFNKGYFKEVPTRSDLTFEVGTLADEADYKRRQYKRIPKPLKADSRYPNKEPMYLYVTEYSSSTVAYLQGSISTAGDAKRGQSLRDRPNKQVVDEDANGNPIYDVDLDVEALIQERSNDIVAMGKTAVSNKPPKQFYSIVAGVKASDDGSVYAHDMRNQMSWATKTKHLKTGQDPFEIIAHTGGNVISKQQGKIINKKVISELIQDYRTNVKKMPAGSYVWIGAGTGYKKSEEAWALVPEDTRIHIKNTTGKNGFYVRKDLVNAIFGYRRVSVRNLIDYLNNSPEDSKAMQTLLYAITNTMLGTYGFKALVFAEDLMTDLTAQVKDAVVVKSILVNLSNTLSNTVQLLTKGMSIQDAIRLQLEGTKFGVKHSMDSGRKSEIEAELSILKAETDYTKKIRNELVAINSRLERNPVSFLMDLGAMQTIVDDLQSFTFEKPNAHRNPAAYFGNKVFEASPKFAQKAFSFTLMRENTELYKWANNAVKLSDFSARYAMIKHLQKVAPTKSMDELMAEVMSEFIDYDIPTARWIQYLNDIGLLWFTKYGLRSLGVAAKLLKDHPENVAKLFLIETLFGDIPTVFDVNPGGRFGDVFSKLESSFEGIATINLADAVFPDWE